MIFYTFKNPLCHLTEKAMAPHSSTLAWKIPWMEEPGRLQSLGLLRVGHDCVTEQVHTHITYLKVAKRLDLKSFHHKKKKSMCN